MRGMFISAFGMAALLLACSSDDDSSGPGAVSSVDSSKNASALSDSEAGQYCKDVQSYAAAHVDQIKKFACAFVGAFSSVAAKTDDEAKTLCRKTFDDCMAKPLETTPTSDSAAEANRCTEFVGKLKSCPATVGDLNQCIVDQLAALGSINGDTICSQVKAPSSQSSASPATSTPLQPPASCTKLQNSCPSIFGSQSSNEPEPTNDTDTSGS